MMDEFIDLSRLKTIKEVARNFGGIPQIRDVYFELKRKIY
jgi:type I restriction enzyme, R subunit